MRVADRKTRSKEVEKKGASVRGKVEARAVGWFLLGPIKKPVSSSVSKSLLWHSRQLRKHLKAPEKPDNTSLVECRVPLGGRRDFAPCRRDTLRPPPCVAISALSYVLNIECALPAPIPSPNLATRHAEVARKFSFHFSICEPIFANQDSLRYSTLRDRDERRRYARLPTDLYYEIIGKKKYIYIYIRV